MTMNTTSRPSSTTALKLASAGEPIEPRRLPPRLLAQFGGLGRESAAASSCSAMTPAARRIALRSQRMPNSRSRTPIASCNRPQRHEAEQRAERDDDEREQRQARQAPSAAGRQPRTVATASTIVKASTTSTTELRKAAETAGAAVVQVSIGVSIARLVGEAGVSSQRQVMGECDTEQETCRPAKLNFRLSVRNETAAFRPPLSSLGVTVASRGAARRRNHSAAMRTSGAAARTSASTCSSNWTKFFWNMATSLRAVWSNSRLFCQVFCG